MRKRLLSPLVLMMLAACVGESEEQSAAADSAGVVPEAAPTATAAPAVTDPQIAGIVVAANEVDIKAGELAQSKATDPRVKEFATRMITDHSGVNKAASDLVTKLGVTPESSPTSEQLRQGGEQNLTALQGQSGAAFDRAYIAQEVTYHQAVLDALDQTLIPNAQNAELRALLEKSRPAFVAHLDHAKELQSSLGGSQ